MRSGPSTRSATSLFSFSLACLSTNTKSAETNADGISSVESDSHGMIAEAFLSHDARHGVKHAREVTEQLTDAVNRQTSAIDHIVSLPTVNDSFFGWKQNRLSG